MHPCRTISWLSLYVLVLRSCSGCEESVAGCLRDGDTALCSGRGRCVCGQCECDSLTLGGVLRYSGRFCECNDYSCPKVHNVNCGGPKHGVCSCGQCKCMPEYTGEACECHLQDFMCVATKGDPARLCAVTEPCVRCRLGLSTGCEAACGGTLAFYLDNLPGDGLYTKCSFTTQTDLLTDGHTYVRTCTYHYTSLYDPLGDATHVSISKHPNCA